MIVQAIVAGPRVRRCSSSWVGGGSPARSAVVPPPESASRTSAEQHPAQEHKPPGMHGDYGREVFERLLESRFDVVDRGEFPSGSRTLYHATPRR
jgi:hypothetical protein